MKYELEGQPMLGEFVVVYVAILLAELTLAVLRRYQHRMHDLKRDSTP